MTTQKKELGIRMLPDGRMYEVHYVGGGELPADLQGRYTSKKFAQADIAAYLNKRDGVNGATKKTSRAK